MDAVQAHAAEWLEAEMAYRNVQADVNVAV